MLERVGRLVFATLIVLSSLSATGSSVGAAASPGAVSPGADSPAQSQAPTALGQNSIAFSGSAPGGTFQTNSYVSVPYSASLNPYGGSITIEAWVKRTDASRCETVVGNNWTTSYWLGFCPDKLRFYAGGGVAVDSNGSVPAGVWTHVAVTYDGFTRHYYINGILDTTSTANSGPITPAPNGQELDIGADVAGGGYYFSGMVQQVRIWNTVRSAAQIRASMYQSFGAPQSGLLAEWHFAGDLNDPAGGNNGTAHDYALYSNDGAIPHDVHIPQVSATPTLDGFCNTQTEYANAIQVTVGGASAYLMHTATNLWVCFTGLADPVGVHDNWAAIYLDVNHTRVDPAQPDHYSLEVHSTGVVTRTRLGDSVGNYTTTLSLNGAWDGRYTYCCGEFPTRSAEFVISSTLMGGWSHVVGMALAQHWITRVGDDRLWPALAVWNLPSTWSNATLGGVGAPRTFTGQVAYQPRDGSALVGIPGVGVNLIGSDAGGSEVLAATAQSNLDGSFSLTSDDDYSLHRLELDPNSVPRGYVPQSSAPITRSVDARTIDYGNAGPGTYPGNIFAMGDAKPYVVDPTNGSYFLIVAPQSIINGGALKDFVDFKQRLGLQVEVISTESVAKSFGGATLRDQIRNLELARLASFGSRFKYVLLVGPHSVIPVSFVNPYTISTTDCTTNAGLPTDWYYADLTSNWDSNGNGCLGDGIWSDPTKRAPGYTPDSGIAFNPTVSVGRLPFTTVSAVHTALSNIMGFEQQANSFKSRTVLAASMMDILGRCWTPAGDTNGHYQTDNCDRVDQWGTDGSYLTAAMQNNFMNADGYSSVPFYENQHPATGSSPAHLISPQPASEPNIVAQLQSQTYGMVNLTGHGNGAGVYRTPWSSDPNGNGIVENPSSPPQNAYEVSGWPDLLTTWGVSGVTARNTNGAVFVTASCSTGQYNDPNSFGAQVLSQGHGVAWVGGLETVQYYLGWTGVNNGPNGGMMDMDYFVTSRLLDSNLRLGDAFWSAMRQFIANGNTDFSGIDYDLYGDPSMSYWGNPGGQSTLSAWPMLRENAFGQGYTTLTGPGIPKTLWTYSATAPGTSTLPPSPVVSNNGEVIVAHGAFVDVLRRGALYQRLNLDNAAFGAPAIAADGTIYALDVTGKLYAFPYSSFIFCYGYHCFGSGLLSPWRYRRWAVNLGSAPLTSPVIGSDGFVAVGRTGGDFFGIVYSWVDMVRPDGAVFRAEPILGNAIGALAVSASKIVYASTSTGTLVRIDFFCAAGTCKIDDGSGAPNSTPPLLAYGAVYLGRSDGVVVEKNSASLATVASFTADSAITAGPVAGPGGQILVGTQNGTLYSLSASLTLRWQRNIGASVTSVPAFSDNALYIVSGNYLRAYAPFSGAPMWSRYLGGGTGSGSASVGYGREVYVQSSNGQITGVGEGWAYPIWHIIANPVLLGPIRDSLHAIAVQWLPVPPPPPNPGFSASSQPAPAAAQTISGYLLQRSSDGTDWEDVAVLPDGTTIYTDTSVLEGIGYMYRVQVLDPNGNDSDFVSTPDSTTPLPPLPQRPALDSVSTVAADSLSVAWHSPVGDEVTAYRVERSLSASGPFTPTALTTADTVVFTDTALAAGTPYYYQVVALNDTGESLPSNIISGTTRVISLPAPQNVTATLMSNGQVQISWTGGPAGATAVVEVNPLGFSGYQFLGTTPAAGPFTYDPGVPSSFGYRVKFVQGNAESAYGVTTLRVATMGFENVFHYRVFLPIVMR